MVINDDAQQDARKEARREYNRKWREANREKCREYQREWKAKNRAKVREYNSTWAKNNREKRRAYINQHNAAIRERIRERDNAWCGRNRELKRVSVARARVKRTYGLTLEEYNAMKNLPCEICGRTLAPRFMHIDHTVDGTHHGVLCNGCNVGIGMLQHDPVVLQSALSYLRRTR